MDEQAQHRARRTPTMVRWSTYRSGVRASCTTWCGRCAVTRRVGGADARARLGARAGGGPAAGSTSRRVDGDRPEQRIAECARPLPAYGGVTGWASCVGAGRPGSVGPSTVTHTPAVPLADRASDAVAQPAGHCEVSEETAGIPRDLEVADGTPRDRAASAVVCFEMRYARNLREAVRCLRHGRLRRPGRRMRRAGRATRRSTPGGPASRSAARPCPTWTRTAGPPRSRPEDDLVMVRSPICRVL